MPKRKRGSTSDADRKRKAQRQETTSQRQRRQAANASCQRTRREQETATQKQQRRAAVSTFTAIYISSYNNHYPSICMFLPLLILPPKTGILPSLFNLGSPSSVHATEH